METIINQSTISCLSSIKTLKIIKQSSRNEHIFTEKGFPWTEISQNITINLSFIINNIKSYPNHISFLFHKIYAFLDIISYFFVVNTYKYKHINRII